MTALEELKAARQLIEQGWCKGVFAQNNHYLPVDCKSEEACRFCALGALRRVSYWFDLRSEQALAEALGTHKIGEWNDDPARTKEDVLAVYDKAIAAAVHN